MFEVHCNTVQSQTQSNGASPCEAKNALPVYYLHRNAIPKRSIPRSMGSEDCCSKASTWRMRSTGKHKKTFPLEIDKFWEIAYKCKNFQINNKLPQAILDRLGIVFGVGPPVASTSEVVVELSVVVPQ
jgi:hypothetical protein